MRLLLAIVLILGAAAALPEPADARRSARAHTAQPRHYAPRYRPRAYYYQAPGYYYYRPAPSVGAVSPRQVCEERAFAEDPTGKYAGYPCWAREAFGRTPTR
jgi:hypothetical protein